MAGRLFCGFVADFACCNKLIILQVGFLCLAVATALVHLARQYIWVALYSAVFGFSEGTYVMLFIVIVRELVGLKDMSFALGMAFSILAIPKTLGPLLAGFLFDITQSYTLAFMVGSGFVFMSTMLISAIDLNKRTDGQKSHKEQVPTVYEVVCKETSI